MIKILIATKNPGKAREMKIFLGSGFEIVCLADLPNTPDIEENGNTFEENALLKARFYFDWSGIPSVADDAGLEIDYLNGEPGVLSRRWPSFTEASEGRPGSEKTDEELINLALEKLKGVPKEKRTARLRTVGLYYDGKNTLSRTASVEGYITEDYCGHCEKGYPFRSIFWIPKFSKLYQDLTHEEHEEINHRKVVYGQLAQDIATLKKSRPPVA